MSIEKLYNEKKTLLDSKLKILEDKPEENSDSTLKALWFAAFGEPKSAELAILADSLPELSDKQISKLDKLIEERLNNIPLAHLTNRQRFMGIEMLADKRALIPRKETEILAGRALEISLEFSEEKGKVNIIDVCCGAGNVGLSIAYHNPLSKVFSCDLSGEAVELTEENIQFIGLADRVQAKQGDLFEPFMSDVFYGKMDMITCNPPYITTFKVSRMDAEVVGKEPGMAFDGGMFGIKIIQRVIREAPQFLIPGGWLLFEIGLGQGPMITDLCMKTGLYSQVDPVEDSKGNIRVITCRTNNH